MLEDVRFGEGQEIVSNSDILKAVVEGNLIQHRQSVAIQSLVKCFDARGAETYTIVIILTPTILWFRSINYV